LGRSVLERLVLEDGVSRWVERSTSFEGQETEDDEGGQDGQMVVTQVVWPRQLETISKLASVT